MLTKIFFSIVYFFLINTYWTRNIPVIRAVWYKIWRLSSLKYKGNIYTYLHKRLVELPNGHWYLLVIKKYKTFNIPIFECFKIIYNHQNKSPVIMDVGSAVGDTVLFLEEKIKHKNLFCKPRYLCVDGDPAYCKIATYNLNHIKDRVKIFQTLVSSTKSLIPEIIKVDPTTGSSSGTQLAESKTLDILWEGNNKENIDLLKVDIDGYDSQALKGAFRLIEECRPIIIFEWNVPLFEKTKNDPYEIFPFLNQHSYTNLAWFSNTGVFSFLTHEVNKETIDLLIQYQKMKQTIDGSHFDIIAIPDEKKHMLYSLFD